jgi:WXG100 family type VII secretion target
MAGQYDVSLDTMAQSQARMVGNVDSIRSELSALRGRLDAVQGQWMGEGNTAFTAAQVRYESANQKLNAALDTLASLVQGANTNYATSDQDAGSAINRTLPGFETKA